MRNPLVTLACAAVLYGGPAEVRKADELYSQTRYKEALEAIRPHLDGRDAAAYMAAGRAAFGLRDFKQSASHFEKAAQLDPKRAEHHHWLGRALGRRAETAFPVAAPHYASKARQSFEKAVSLDPRNGEALNDLFDYYLQAPGFLGGGLDKAQSLLPKIRALDEAEYEYAQAQMQESRKEFNTAEQHLKRAAELAPKSVGRVLDVARFFARRGRFAESFAWISRAEKIAPKDPQVLYGKAQTHIEAKKDLRVAKQLLEEYLRAPLNPDLPSREEALKLLKQASSGE
ncbi:MAG: hypothetical protein FJW32_01495 [Acidobacteria bacterium]|nr:hypothetical protein [Acidobacteriota bacterium]